MNTVKKTFELIAVACVIIGSGLIAGCTEGHGHFIGIDGIARNLPGLRNGN